MNVSKLRVSFLVESSDHTGYCSEGENEYTESIQHVDVDVNRTFKTDGELTYGIKYIIQKLKSFCTNPHYGGSDDPYIKQITHLIPDMHDDSCYCEVSIESRLHRLGKHEFKITLINYKIIAGPPS